MGDILDDIARLILAAAWSAVALTLLLTVAVLAYFYTSQAAALAVLTLVVWAYLRVGRHMEI